VSVFDATYPDIADASLGSGDGGSGGGDVTMYPPSGDTTLEARFENLGRGNTAGRTREGGFAVTAGSVAGCNDVVRGDAVGTVVAACSDGVCGSDAVRGSTVGRVLTRGRARGAGRGGRNDDDEDDTTELASLSVSVSLAIAVASSSATAGAGEAMDPNVETISLNLCADHGTVSITSASLPPLLASSPVGNFGDSAVSKRALIPFGLSCGFEVESLSSSLFSSNLSASASSFAPLVELSSSFSSSAPSPSVSSRVLSLLALSSWFFLSAWHVVHSSSQTHWPSTTSSSCLFSTPMSSLPSSSSSFSSSTWRVPQARVCVYASESVSVGLRGEHGL
jgi:hypothetical protein